MILRAFLVAGLLAVFLAPAMAADDEGGWVNYQALKPELAFEEHQAAELLVAAVAPDDGTVFGRRTMPAEMALCSVACAIQNLWLVARAETLGLGWVSMFDPAALARLLKLPPQAKPIAILCLGPVEAFYERPMLEQQGWRQGRPLRELVFEDHWVLPFYIVKDLGSG